MLRFERKFRTSTSDSASVALRLKAMLPGLVEDYPDRVVHSLYFDDSASRHYQEHSDGAGERSKFRIRWYRTENVNSIAAPIAPLFDLSRCSLVNFEAKLRIGSLISKSSQVSESGLIGDLSRRFASPLCYESLARKAGASTTFPDLIAPVVFVSYVRRYLRFAGTQIRVTVDSSIRVGGFNPECVETIPLPGDPVIIETKCAPSDLTDVARRLRSLPWPEVAFSKYMKASRSVQAG